jgi:hypothetical protein
MPSDPTDCLNYDLHFINNKDNLIPDLLDTIPDLLDTIPDSTDPLSDPIKQLSEPINQLSESHEIINNMDVVKSHEIINNEDVVKLHQIIKSDNYLELVQFLAMFPDKYQKLIINCNTLENTGYRSSLHCAATHHHPPICECTDNYHCQTEYQSDNCYQIVELLLDRGADIYNRDIVGDYPYNYATSTCPYVRTSSAPIVSELLLFY